jgi:hypothetical protein
MNSPSEIQSEDSEEIKHKMKRDQIEERIRRRQ